MINRKHKVKIIACTEVTETEIKKSASKKVAGAIVGGALTGGVGAVVGALAVGNNDKKVTKFDKLVATDENGYTHEVILKQVFMQRQAINNSYLNS
ncbi:BMT2 family SAM-dependent methyltransferase [Metabacillus litoralis]|uniref:BMT2 family SAM-dependent methyltransferase n=1 Tax=Metabacillus litoralis TaxID=152268 RepID=UPI001E2D73BD|nr:BMT2 family SAM-dependent methyltransferase [Metabacillus litoralis]UHA60659.1 BMT2 family SAM-dependent methyltransferase [Metabacillus litoralis]